MNQVNTAGQSWRETLRNIKISVTKGLLLCDKGNQGRDLHITCDSVHVFISD